jgi:perosamine synthetase
MPTCDFGTTDPSCNSPESFRQTFEQILATEEEQAGRLSRMHFLGTGAVAELEGKLRRHYRMKHALCVSSATSGLLALALALDLRGAEFISTAFTWGGSLAGWLLLGARPRFADINAQDLGVDPDAARELITPATKALLAVDTLGIPSDTRALRALADEFGLWYVADAAQSLGSLRDGMPGSALADAVVVSFTTGKTIFAGEGGAILTNHSEVYEKLLWFCQHPDRQRRELSLAVWNEFGLNCRIHPLAALGANAAFDSSLDALTYRRAARFQAIDLMNASGLIEPIRLKAEGILPSFSRLTASWKDEPHPSNLYLALAAGGYRARIEPSPVRLIYRQPAFRAQFPLPQMPCCPVAEWQARQRFCIVPDRSMGACPAHGVGSHDEGRM